MFLLPRNDTVFTGAQAQMLIDSPRMANIEKISIVSPIEPATLIMLREASGRDGPLAGMQWQMKGDGVEGVSGKERMRAIEGRRPKSTTLQDFAARARARQVDDGLYDGVGS